MSDHTPEMGTHAPAVAPAPEAPNVLSGGCSEPGCRVRPALCVYRHASGGKACISHAADQRPKTLATASGGEAARRRKVRFMPAETPDPDWSSPKAIRKWLEERAGLIERGELDKQALPADLAKLAKETHDAEALEKLDGLERLIKERLLGGSA